MNIARKVLKFFFKKIYKYPWIHFLSKDHNNYLEGPCKNYKKNLNLVSEVPENVPSKSMNIAWKVYRIFYLRNHENLKLFQSGGLAKIPCQIESFGLLFLEKNSKKSGCLLLDARKRKLQFLLKS